MKHPLVRPAVRPASQIRFSAQFKLHSESSIKSKVILCVSEVSVFSLLAQVLCMLLGSPNWRFDIATLTTEGGDCQNFVNRQLIGPS